MLAEAIKGKIRISVRYIINSFIKKRQSQSDYPFKFSNQTTSDPIQVKFSVATLSYFNISLKFKDLLKKCKY
jgi:hypothetical protein